MGDEIKKRRAPCPSPLRVVHAVLTMAKPWRNSISPGIAQPPRESTSQPELPMAYCIFL